MGRRVQGGLGGRIEGWIGLSGGGGAVGDLAQEADLRDLLLSLCKINIS